MKNLYIFALLFTLSLTAYAGSGFVENKGQVADQNRNAVPTLLYLYNGEGLNMQLRQTGFSYDVWRKVPAGAGIDEDKLEYNRIDVEFAGMYAGLKVMPGDGSKDYLNYYTDYTDKTGVTKIREFNSITYKNVWPNVDMNFVMLNGSPKYNFIVRPGGKLTDIKLRITGADKIAVQDSALLMTTKIGVVQETMPASYYSFHCDTPEIAQIPVGARFVINADGTYGVRTVEPIPQKTALVIDPLPNVIWGSFYGGSDADNATVTCTDSMGNVYLAGSTQSTGVIATTGAFQNTISLLKDAYIVKLNGTGKRIWATYFGGAGIETMSAMRTNMAGDRLAFCGTTTSLTGLSSTNAFQTGMTGGTNDMFVGMFDSAGARVWSSYFGGLQDEIKGSLLIDQFNNLYLGATTRSSGLATPGTLNPGLSGDYDGVISKFDASGNRMWGTYFGSVNYDDMVLANIVGDSLYIAGTTNSVSGIATTGSSQATLAGALDGYIAKLNISGNSIFWSTYTGGAGNDYITAATGDAQGNIYVAGNTASAAGIATSGKIYQTANGGGANDMFLMRYSSKGDKTFGTYYGGSGDEQVNALVQDKKGFLYMTGTTSSMNMIATLNVLQTSIAGGTQMFMAKFENTGMIAWGSYYTGAVGNSIAVDNSNNIYMAGDASVASVGTAGVYQQYHGGGGTDGFVLKLSGCAPGFSSVSSNSPVPLGGKIILTASGGITYSWTSSTGFSSLSNNPNISGAKYSDTGTYKVVVTDGFSCTDTQYLKIVVIDTTTPPTAVGRIDAGMASIFPNPTTGIASMRVKLVQDMQLSIAITDETGKLVQQMPALQYRAGEQQITLNMEQLASGVYHCSIISSGNKLLWVGKIVVAK